jgi:hypothetical protein
MKLSLLPDKPRVYNQPKISINKRMTPGQLSIMARGYHTVSPSRKHKQALAKKRFVAKRKGRGNLELSQAP